MSEASLSKAIDAAGGQAPLSRALGITYQAIDSWKKRGVPPSRVLDVERHTGVSRHELRPDIFGSSPAATREADAGATHVDGPSRAAPADHPHRNSFDLDAFVHFVTTLWPVDQVVEASFYFGVPPARLTPILDGSIEPSAEDRKLIESRMADVRADPCEVLRTGRAA